MSGRRNAFRGNLLSSGKPLKTGDYGTKMQSVRLVSTGLANVIPLSVPGAPTKVVATLSGNNAAVITWNAPINKNGSINNGGSVITSYRITCSSGFILDVLGSLTSALFTGLSSGTTFTFTIVAINSIGSSPPSSPSNSISTIFVPTAPIDVVATLVGTSEADISWNAPLDNGGSVITSYIITCSSGFTLDVLGSLTSALFTGLSSGTTFTFTIVAINSIGSSPPSSPSNSISTIFVPTAPIDVVATLVGTSEADISWNAPLDNGGSVITSYIITCSSGFTLDVLGSLTYARFIGLSSGTPFTFTIVAINSIGSSPPSSPSNSITTPPI